MMKLLKRSWVLLFCSFPGATVADNKPADSVRRISQKSISGQTPCPWLMV